MAEKGCLYCGAAREQTPSGLRHPLCAAHYGQLPREMQLALHEDQRRGAAYDLHVERALTRLDVINPPMRTCPHCGTTFQSNSLLRRHMRGSCSRMSQEVCNA